MPTKSIENEKTMFVNQFVNSVYGILLGYGFSNAMKEIKDGELHGVGALFSSVSVLFIITVICIRWWDWLKNIGHNVKNDVREFALDIIMLICLEWLFFVFEYPVYFCGIFLFLSILSLLWVKNYHLTKYRESNLESWDKYIQQNSEVKNYIKNRWKGVALFSFCFIVTIVINKLVDYESLFKKITGDTHWNSFLSGNWIELFLIIFIWSFNRIRYFKKRSL